MMNEFDVRLLMLNNITELHVGSAEGSNIADQAIQRNIHMQIPKIDAATWKGAYLEVRTKQQRESEYGQVSYSDLNILFFPVTNERLLYIHITCPEVWNNFIKMKYMNGFIDEKCLKKERIELSILPDEIFINKDYGDIICISDMFLHINKQCEQPISIDWDMLTDSFNDKISTIGVVSNETFSFLTRTNVSIVTRNNLHNANVFTTEYLPENCFFYGTMTSFIKIPERKSISQDKECNLNFQLGADASLGKGFVKLWEIHKKRSIKPQIPNKKSSAITLCRKGR